MNTWQISQLKYAVGIGSLMSFYGIAAFIAWFIGDKFGYSGSQRIVVIALLLLTMPFALLTGYVVTRRSKKKEEAAAAEKAAADSAPKDASTTADAGTPKLAAPTGSYEEITRSTEEVVQFLKSSDLGAGGKDAVYSLPWYIIAGMPKSGKSSLVLGSNLNFQALPSQRPSELRSVRATPNIDWRVTSDAVFIDTAGRYQTEGADADEWSALLETVRKYRPNRPIDGFLLVVNAEEVLRSGERDIERIAKLLRARLDEVMQRVKVRFPVYIIFTNADSIEGFRDSFSTSKNEDKTLVWGSTIPLDKSENAQSLFDGEYEILHDAVMRRRLTRLSAPFPPVRQLRIFNFPLHFGAARRKFVSFINTLFRPNPFTENPFLRGFYFTAAPAGKSPSGAPVPGGGYFTERLFRDVVLRDKDLVRTFQAQKQRAPVFGWLMTLLGAFVVVALLALTGVSLASNKRLLDDAKVRGQKVLGIVRADAGKTTLQKSDDEVRRELTAADELRTLLVRLDDYERNGAPLHMRFGLYSGDRVYKQNLLPIYMSVIEQRFKAPTVRKIEADLKKFASSQAVSNPNQLTAAEEENLSKNYDLLKAYLMLAGGEYTKRAEATHISNTLKDYWTSESKLPADMEATARQQLDFWAKQVDRDTDEYRFPRILPDEKLVSETRRKLLAFPASQRYYKRIATEISKTVEDTAGVMDVNGIIVRNGADSGFLKGTYVVPGAYTKAGYELMKSAIAESDQRLSEDDWVMGEAARSGTATVTDSAKLLERYERDYADHWRNFVKGVDVVDYSDKSSATAALNAFSSSSSPIKILLTEVYKNTNLAAPAEGDGWIAWIQSWFSKSAAKEEFGSSPVEKDFRPLFTFIGKKDDPASAPVEKYANELNNVYKSFSSLSDDQFREAPKKIADDKDTMRLSLREGNISDLTKNFGETPAGQEVAALLQEPLENVRELFGADARTQLAKVWNDQILSAAAEVERGYPFQDGEAEADLTKLTAYLNPSDGKLSVFYKENLSKYFEESNGQLKVRDTSEVKFTDEFVAYLNNAFALRTMLFGTNATPKFEYEFRLVPVSGAVVEVTIDGQKITSEGTGSVKGSFPAASATETGVVVSMLSTGSSPAPSANSSADSVNNTSTTTTTAASPSDTTLRFPGNWGLFRFVDAGKPQKQASGGYALTYSVGGRSVGAEIRPSGGDVFDKSMFTRTKAPQNFIK